MIRGLELGKSLATKLLQYTMEATTPITCTIDSAINCEVHSAEYENKQSKNQLSLKMSQDD